MLKNAISLGAMILFSPSKINLGLQVIERRSDGYHNIQSVMLPVGLCDILEIKRMDLGHEGIAFTQTGIQLESEPAFNLCIRAYQIFNEEVKLPPLGIHLHKQIPVGAGLGGGSSNASHTLMGLNKLTGEPVPEKKLHEMAASLGSDCPFFLHGKPMLAEGRGEILGPLSLDLGGLFLVLFHAGIHISTVEAYGGVTPSPLRNDLSRLVQEPVKVWRKQVVNDFERPVFSKYPELELLKQSIYRAGALFASLSGSGSALYGLFPGFPKLPADLARYVIWKGIL
jgi:4-diphosphocytidyl-2-C-methyl-D-erythritol kinase